MKYGFKSIGGAVRKIRMLEKIIDQYYNIVCQYERERLLLAKLASKEPMFYSPLDVSEAEKIRDRILGRKS